MKLVRDPTGVLEHYEAEGVLALPQEELLTHLRGRLTGRVQAAWIFGSRARATATGGSDLDLILIHQTGRPFHERRADFEDLFDELPELDLLVYTPEEFQRLTTNPTLGFWSDVVAEMVRVV